MIQRKFKIAKKLVRGYQIKLPKANLVLVATDKGYICCGYLDLKIAEKLGDIACRVTGVKTVDDLLNAKIITLTSGAKSRGIKAGMAAKEVLKKFL